MKVLLNGLLVGLVAGLLIQWDGALERAERAERRAADAEEWAAAIEAEAQEWMERASANARMGVGP